MGETDTMMMMMMMIAESVNDSDVMTYTRERCENMIPILQDVQRFSEKNTNHGVANYSARS